MAQGDNVCREAVFEQDTSVSLTVQLSYETIPVDHEAWTKSVPVAPELFIEIVAMTVVVSE